ncbi:MAG: sigma-54-dependent Fis family transcriptional regulator [Candidatus Marinimicrobia bacterium]|jgi:DNA-binding NtrC family response regulator|nr:sigma-54-dependent Fis family transcriptional regulator [Candidatus Neomarinimicrobiota bacterium]MBT3630793.1 sigma-54-dependent Fis family transcriptional regulator [Candidatus Neomarinimicrobiota bacterium]MBT3825595.1 sigma-54-dependent Fis family transcriptional regulator [Candidatus Neomarinimicrobiota bacterium]MBT4131185.1 sigma-54-dependent Fis family transcriptional regulator [Candidatus Neomarinimicrobiota bacterium]MBT4296355.1 sigma-54-dependent Fis family transcriptional regula
MDQDQIKVLLIEDEEYDVRRIKNTIDPFRERIQIEEIVSTGEDALKAIKDRGPFDVAILDYQISGGLYGERLLKRIREIDATIQVVVITKMTINQTDIQFATQMLDSGAYWFGTKYPSDIEDFIYQPTDFILTILNAAEKKQLENDRIRSQKRLDRKIDRIVQERPLLGESQSIEQVRDHISKFAVTQANVLIVGESGSGKELIARNIHYQSDRRYENFVTVNCAAIPGELIESELFGFIKGAFTGAKADKAGLFEQANLGTIFLDEISELPYLAQAKLLRVLETGEMDKIGRKKSYMVDVRVISATNKNLKELMKQNKFREDLYYRLNILNIQAPAIRDRQDDIPLLIKYFVDHYCHDLSIVPPVISEKAWSLLEQYGWPGNVRQLKNVVQRLVILGMEGITEDTVNLALDMQSQDSMSSFVNPVFTEKNLAPLKEVEHDFRKQYFEYVRKHSKTDTEAAGKLGLAPPNFHRMCKELGLK